MNELCEYQNARCNDKKKSGYSHLLALPWLRRLITGLSLWKPSFYPGSVHVRFVVLKEALGQIFLRILRSVSSRQCHAMLHTRLQLYAALSRRTKNGRSLGSFQKATARKELNFFVFKVWRQMQPRNDLETSNSIALSITQWVLCHLIQTRCVILKPNYISTTRKNLWST